jgi:hypothetical protein
VSAGLLDEVWVGGFAHDISDLGGGKESGTWDVSLEADSVKPRALRFLGAPRVNAFLMLNSRGLSNFGAAGLTWDHRLVSHLYATADFGVGYADGVLTAPPGRAGEWLRERRLLLGSRALFREAVGVHWKLSRRWLIGAEFTHDSNGHILASHYNEGITDVGLRVGYRFR